MPIIFTLSLNDFGWSVESFDCTFVYLTVKPLRELFTSIKRKEIGNFQETYVESKIFSLIRVYVQFYT